MNKLSLVSALLLFTVVNLGFADNSTTVQFIKGNVALSDSEGAFTYVSFVDRENKSYGVAIYPHDGTDTAVIEAPKNFITGEMDYISLAFPKNTNNETIYSKLLVFPNYSAWVNATPGYWQLRSDVWMLDIKSKSWTHINKDRPVCGFRLAPSENNNSSIVRGRIFVPTQNALDYTMETMAVIDYSDYVK